MKRQKKNLRVKIRNCQRKITINKKKIAYLARQILKKKGVKEAELGILFVGKRRMCTYNRKFRKIDRPTDVLAFSMREGKMSRYHPEILGDVVICPEMAQDFARTYKTTITAEIYLYLTHGVLHLLGYNDLNARERHKIEKEQSQILKNYLKMSKNVKSQN
jgi:probable rRNA maturation factor